MAAEEAAKPSTLPPYPEMILAALEALNDKNGSNKSAIARHIEGKYGDLPPAHASLLTAHLARMKESGELLFIKNNYFRAGAVDVPPKRGRGRPPKPRDPNAPPPAPKPASPRPRGRPRKVGGSLDAAVAKATAGMPRPRGRPPKAKRAPDAAVAHKASAGTPRPRGRPPKKAKTDAPTPAPTGDGSTPAKRGRGRPPKVRPAVPSETAAA